MLDKALADHRQKKERKNEKNTTFAYACVFPFIGSLQQHYDTTGYR